MRLVSSSGRATGCARRICRRSFSGGHRDADDSSKLAPADDEPPPDPDPALPPAGRVAVPVTRRGSKAASLARPGPSAVAVATAASMPASSAAPLFSLPDLRVLRDRAVAAATRLCTKLPEGASVDVDGLSLSIAGRRPLTLGPGPVRVVHSPGSLDIDFRSPSAGRRFRRRPADADADWRCARFHRADASRVDPAGRREHHRLLLRRPALAGGARCSRRRRRSARDRAHLARGRGAHGPRRRRSRARLRWGRAPRRPFAAERAARRRAGSSPPAGHASARGAHHRWSPEADRGQPRRRCHQAPAARGGHRGARRGR